MWLVSTAITCIESKLFRSDVFESERDLTSRHLLHEDLDEAVLADGTQVLHNVLVLQVFVESDFLVERLRVSAQQHKKSFDSTDTE